MSEVAFTPLRLRLELILVNGKPLFPGEDYHDREQIIFIVACPLVRDE
jgi:hypothetical protein